MVTETGTERVRSKPAHRVQTLTDADVDALRLGWQTKLEPDEIRRTLHLYPGRSVWLPETLEFAVVGPWRHRDEIAHIQELCAVRHPKLLIDAMVERCRGTDADVLLAIELDETRRPAFYEHIGFDLIEEVITFELDRVIPRPGQTARVRFERADPADDATRAALVAIDHVAFPWLWRNSDAEFRVYGLTPGVEMFLGFREGEPVSYLGLTSYFGWGHLDRIAVWPDRQGEGIGRESLAFAVEQLGRRGARRIGLSTQRANLRSQCLYERFGFRRSTVNDYRLYGRSLEHGGAGPGTMGNGRHNAALNQSR